MDYIDWNNIETRHSIIRYQSIDDLLKFNNTINFNRIPENKREAFYNLKSDNLKKTIAQKVDAIYQRVQEILGMRRNLKKVRINLYSNEKQLHHAYSNIYHEPCNLRAWYIFEKNTVYLNLQDLNEGMLAHEMAHSVIDHYLIISPPRSSAEILARHVDRHLHQYASVDNTQGNHGYPSAFTE